MLARILHLFPLLVDRNKEETQDRYKEAKIRLSGSSIEQPQGTHFVSRAAARGRSATSPARTY